MQRPLHLILVALALSFLTGVSVALATDDAVSREVVLYNDTDGSQAPREFDDVVSREVVAYNDLDGSQAPREFDDVVSREVVVYNDLDGSQAPREFDDVVSREVALFNDLDGAYTIAFVDAISREVSVYRPSPDLRVVAIALPTGAQTDDPITVTWTLRNEGDATLVGPWKDRVRLSSDATPDPNDPVLGFSTSIGSTTIEPGEELVRSTVVTAPSVVGSYYLVIDTDVDDQIAEYQAGDPAESDNTLASAVSFEVTQAPRPDLIVSSITPPPGNVLPGQTVSVAWTIKNIGNAPATGTWNEQLYGSVDDQVGGDIPGPVAAVTNIIQPGQEVLRIQNYTVPSVPPGGYWIVVCIDTGSTIVELDEANNCAIEPVCVNCLTANLTPQSLFATSGAGAGTPLPLTWVVSNTGQGDASGQWIDRVYLSSDQAIGQDIQIASETITGGLPVGQPYSRNVLAPIGYDVPEGTYFVLLQVDAANAVSEPGGEGDNVFVAPATVTVSHPPTADLVVSTISAPSGAVTGSSVTVSWDVTNLGSVAAALPWTDRVLLSTDAILGNDVIVAIPAANQPIPAGETRSYSVAIPMPSTPGQRWVVVQLDSGDAVEEGANEGNNALIATAPIEISLPPSPDFSVAAVGAAPPGAVNDLVPISWTVSNDGPVATTGSWQERVYASPDDAVGADLTLATFTFNDTIAPGSSVTRTKSVPVPNLPNGYRIVVCVDILNAVTEPNESNNCGIAGASSVVLLADLVASAIVAPPSAVADQPLTVSFAVTNGGAAPAQGTWVDAVYLSADDQLGDDVLLGTAFRSGPLAAGQPYPVNVTGNVPGLLQGTYRVVVVTDALGAVTESGEGPSNALFASGTIEVTQPPRPNLVVLGISSLPAGLVGQTATFSYAVQNAGPSIANGSWTDRVSAVNVATGAVVTLKDEFVAGPVAASGGTYGKSLSITYPTAPGTYRIRVELDRTNLLNEGVAGGESDNVSDAPSTFLVDGYTVTVSTPVDKTVGGTPIPLAGAATLSNGSPAANVPIVVAVDVQGTTRQVQATTAASGAFSATFQPLATEGGAYGLRAGPPGLVGASVQDSFVLHNLLPKPANRALTVYPTRESVTTTFDVANVGDVPLTGLSIVPGELPTGLSIVASSAATTIPPLSAVPVELVVNATVSAAFGTYEVPVAVSVAQGVTKTFVLSVTVQPLAAQLVAARSSLTAAMVVPPSAAESAQTIVEFQVTNVGAGVAEAVEIQIPSAPWLSLGVSGSLGSIGPGESRSIVLVLSPSVGQQLGPYTGTLVVLGSNVSATIPFTFTAVSTKKGDLTVTVTDEFTYWSAPGCPDLPECPRVANATISVRDPYTNTLVAQATTDESGVVTFADLPEAYYAIKVTAPEHGEFASTIFVNGADDVDVEAFLPATVVSYEWSVVPTYVNEQYDITLQASFQTFVPAPVLTIEPAFVDLTKMTGPSMQVDFTIRNHGLIAAQDAFWAVNQHPRYRITPLVTELGDIPGTAQGQEPTPLVVPCLIEDLEFDAGGGVAGDGCLDVGLALCWFLFCNDFNKYSTSVSFAQFDVDCGGWTPGGGGGGGGGGGPAGPTLSSSSPPPAVQWLPCGACDPEKEEPQDIACLTVPIKAIKNRIKALAEKSSRQWIKNLTDLIDADAKLCLETCCDPATGTRAVRGAASAGVGLSGSTELIPEISIPVVGDVQLQLPGSSELVTAAVNAVLPIPIPVLDAAASVSGNVKLSTVCGKLIPELTATASSALSLTLELEPPAPIQIPITLPDGEVVQGALTGTLRLEGDFNFSFEYKAPPGQTTVKVCFKGVHWKLSPRLEALGNSYPLGCADGYLIDPYKKNSPCPTFEGCDGAGGVAGESSDPALDAELDAIVAELTSELDSLLAIFEEFLAETPFEPPPPKAGICATVKIQIDQQLKLARQGFLATLSLDNNGADLPLEGVDIDVRIRDASGNEVGDELFAGLTTPVVTGISDVDGGGSIAPLGSASAQWTLVPSDLAAPNGPTAYFVSGTLRYVRDNVETVIPLFPVPITVLPNPSLALDYFLEARVYSDDPFTPLLEPAIPFSLGLLAANEGGGTAFAATISSSQPKIIENEQGLVISFEIVGSELDSKPTTPSLTVNFGDLEPAERRVAQWFLTSSLQGRFIEFDATWQNVNGLGSPEFSILDSVETWPMQHVVRGLYPNDDGKPDFLVTCPPGVPSGICPFDPLLPPQSLHTSLGTVEPVFAILTGTQVSTAPATLTATVQAPIGNGWNYIRIDDPYLASLTLVEVRRSDGSALLVGSNAWQTSRIVRPLNEPPYPERFVHLFDHGALGPGDGLYTLLFAPDGSVPSVGTWSTVMAHAGIGEVALDIDSAPSAEWTDPRGSLGRLDVAFTEPIDPSTFTPGAVLVEGSLVPENVPYLYSGTIATGLSPDGSVGTLLFDPPLPAQVRYCVRVAGIKDLSGNALTGSSKIAFTLLEGDASNDARVNVADLSAIGSLVGTSPIDPSDPFQVRSDVTRDGAVTIDDVVAALSKNGLDARFVSDPCASLALEEPTSPSSADLAGDTDLSGTVADGVPGEAADSVGTSAASLPPTDVSSRRRERDTSLVAFDRIDSASAVRLALGPDDAYLGMTDATTNLYAVDVPAGATLRVAATASVSEAWTSLMVGDGSVPTIAQHDLRAAIPGRADQVVVLPETSGRTIFIAVDAVIPGTNARAPVAVTIERIPAGIVASAPARAGAGEVTLSLLGGELASDELRLTLLSGSGAVFPAQSLRVRDGHVARATFDLSNAPIGEALDLHWSIGDRDGVAPAVVSVEPVRLYERVETIVPVAANASHAIGERRQLQPGNIDDPGSTLELGERVERAGTADQAMSAPGWPRVALFASREALGIDEPSAFGLALEAGNAEDVTAVVILDPAVDIRSVRLTEIVLGAPGEEPLRLAIPADRADVGVEWPLRDESLAVRALAQLVPATTERRSSLMVRLTVVDRATMERPAIGSAADAALLRAAPFTSVELGWTMRARRSAKMEAGAEVLDEFGSSLLAAVEARSGLERGSAMAELAYRTDRWPCAMPSFEESPHTALLVADDVAALRVRPAVGCADVEKVELHLIADGGPERMVRVAPVSDARDEIEFAVPLVPSVRYSLRARLVDTAGCRSDFGEPVELVALGALPIEPCRAGRALPPFLGRTLAHDSVTIELIDVAGTILATAAATADDDGQFQWLPDGALQLSAGTYLVRVTSAGVQRVQSLNVSIVEEEVRVSDGGAR